MKNQDPTEVELTEKPKWYLSHKFLYPVLGILLFVVIVGSVLWWKEIKLADLLQSGTACAQTKIYKPCSSQSIIVDDKKSWKTYTNTEYGFEFKYPATWVHDDPEENDLTINLAPGRFGDDAGVLTVDLGCKISMNFIDQLHQKSEKKLGNFTFTVERYFTNVTGENKVFLEILSTKLPDNFKKVANCDIAKFVVRKQTNNTEVDQILSTFKFIGKAAISDCKLVINTNEYPKLEQAYSSLVSNSNAFQGYKKLGANVLQICKSNNSLISVSDFSGMMSMSNFDSKLEHSLVLGISGMAGSNAKFYRVDNINYFFEGPGGAACFADKYIQNRIFYTCVEGSDSGSRRSWYVYDIDNSKNILVKYDFQPWEWDEITEVKVYDENLLKQF
jgi:hypothetical protein